MVENEDDEHEENKDDYRLMTFEWLEPEPTSSSQSCQRVKTPEFAEHPGMANCTHGPSNDSS
jgi:hypothetical protein